MKVAECIREGERFLASRGDADARLDAELLIAHLIGSPRGMLPARFRDPVEPGAVESFRALLTRRGDYRIPIQYLTGTREFYSLSFRVDPRVLIPRPETELLVEELLRFRSMEQAAGRRVSLVADVGTGSGCVAIATVVNAPGLTVLATDISQDAIDVASGNATTHGVAGRVLFVRGDLLEGIHGVFDAILSNPPYVAQRELADLQPEVRDHEPMLALVGGPSGLEIYEKLIPQAARLLRPGGLLAVELAAGRDIPVREMLSAGPWAEILTRTDFQGHPRLLAARKQ